MESRPSFRLASALGRWAVPAVALSFCLAHPAAAQGHGDSVWANTHSHVYHCPGSHSYGTSKHGQYMSEAAAVAQHFTPAKGRSCAARASAHAASPQAGAATAHAGQVWVNTRNHEYRCPGASKYGEGKHGVYMTEQAALAAGNQPSHGRRCQ